MAAVSFDALRTLFRFRGNASVGRTYNAFLADRAAVPGHRTPALLAALSRPVADVDAAFLASFKRRLASQPQGTPPRGDAVWPFWCGVLRDVYRHPAPPCTGDEHDDFSRDVARPLFDHCGTGDPFEPMPEARAVLDLCLSDERVAAVCVVSNFDGRVHRVLSDLGLAPQGGRIAVLSSDDVARSKPAPDGLAAAAAALGRTEQGPWLHVGDADADAAAAAEVGASFLRCDPLTGVRVADILEHLAHL